MCMGSSKAPKYTAPTIAPAPAEVAPLVNPEDAIAEATDTPRNSASSRKKLRIDLAPSGGTGLNAPAGI